MPNPRKTVEFEGIGLLTATFKIDAVTIVFDATAARGAVAATLDKAVTLSADDTVALAVDGDAIIGKLLKVESDGYCTVQIGGLTNLPGGLSATLTRGTTIVGALGAASAKGFIRSAASATAAELIKARGRILRAAPATAVVVQL